MHSQDIALEAYVPLFDRHKTVVAYTRVDLKLAGELAKRRWHKGSNGYARRNENSTAILMHRFVLGLGIGDPEVDHINRDKLDNRQANLRLVDHGANQRNQGPRPGKRYLGVYFDKSRKRWRARVCLHGHPHHIGWFGTEDEAGQAANAWTQIHIPERWQNP